MISGRNQNIGCALALVTIARDSEAECLSILWGNSPGFAHVTNFAFPIGGGEV